MKGVHGFAFAGILTGLVLMFAGPALYPEFSRSFRVIWMLISGMLAGGFTGLILQQVRRIDAGMGIGLLTGAAGFLLAGLGAGLAPIITLALGGGIGGVTGLYVQLWALYKAEDSK